MPFLLGITQEEIKTMGDNMPGRAMVSLENSKMRKFRVTVNFLAGYGIFTIFANNPFEAHRIFWEKYPDIEEPITIIEIFN